MSLVAKSYCTSLSTHHLHSEVSWKIQSKSRPESTWEPAAGWPLKICHRHALSYLTVSYFCWDFWQKLIKFKHDKFFKKNLKYKHLLVKARKVGKESFIINDGNRFLFLSPKITLFPHDSKSLGNLRYFTLVASLSRSPLSPLMFLAGIQIYRYHNLTVRSDKVKQ